MRYDTNLEHEYNAAEARLEKQIDKLEKKLAEKDALIKEARETAQFIKDQLFEKKWNGEEGVIEVDFVGFDADGILNKINDLIERAAKH